jgi:transposase
MSGLDEQKIVRVVSEKCLKCGSIAPRDDAAAINVACTW